SDGRKRRFERARTPSWWRRARVSSRRSLRVARADRTAAPVRKTSRIARRVPSGDANVNDCCPDAILARHTSSHAISAPFDIAVDNLTSGATLTNATGATSCALPAGSPLIRSTGAPLWLAPGAAFTATLTFTAPSNAIRFNARVLSGPAGR